MSDKSPGPSSSIQLVPAETKLNLNLCIICQKIKDSSGSSKLTSTSEGRNVLLKTSQSLNDELMNNLSDHDLEKIQYHVKTCYASYKRKGERNEQKKSKLKRTSEEPIDSFLSSPENRQKRTKVSTPASPKEKPCVICNQMKCQGDAKRYRISDLAPAKNLIKAANFNKDSVHTRIVFLRTDGDVFAADMMHHKNCLNKYII